MASQRKMMRKNGNIDSAVRRALLRVAEHKAFSTSVLNTTIASTGTVINLTNGIIEGDDVNQRSGTTLTVIKQHLRFNFEASVTTQSARFILFRDTMNTGTTPTVAEVLPATTFISQYSDVREIQQKRYDIMMDTVLDCSIAGEATKTRMKSFTKKCKVYYNGTTAIAAANGKGAIFLLVIGSASTGTFDYNWQAVYNDS
jgi:hypothetical protein